MPFDHDQVVTAQFQQLAAARAKALGDYEASRLNDDSAGTMEAADRIVDADARLQSLNRIAQNLVADQQHQASRPVSKYGLSEEEKSVAHAALIDRKDLPPLSLEEREREYARNKNRLAAMRANGSYSDQVR
jgi:hypothetical protein